jgi:hypothetical protein
LDIHVYWNLLTMHGPINVKSPNNTSKWQMGFISAFKGLMKPEFSRQSFEKYSNVTSNLIKIHPVGADLFYANRRTDDGQIDMTKL